MRHDCTFEQFFTGIYLPRAKTRKRSWTLDERLGRKHILPVFGARAIRKIAAADVEVWLARLRASGLAPSSCNRILAIFKSAFTLAEALDYIGRGKSPCCQIRNFRIVSRRERYLSRTEGQRLISQLAGSECQQARIVELLLLTGARKSEIIKARWENLDIEKRILTVPLSKSGKPRHIYLPESAVEILRRIRRREDSPWIFPGRNPQRPISDIYRFWNKIRTILGIRDMRIHDLRHSFASFIVADGHTLYIAQQLLGHSDPRTTMRYAHFAQNTLIGATATLDCLFGKPSEPDSEMRNCQKSGKQKKKRHVVAGNCLWRKKTGRPDRNCMRI